MKKIIALKPYSGNIFLKNRIFKINNGSNIFYNFDKELKNHNIEINTIDIVKKDTDKIVYCDVPYPWEIKLWKIIFSNRKKNILFCFESPIINPFSHLRFFYTPFLKVYTWNDSFIDNKKYFKFCIPQLHDGLNINLKKFEKKKFIALINSNKKIPLLLKLFSLNKKNLFKEREKIINFFEKKIPDKFFLYGRGWNKKNKYSITDLIFGPKIYSTYKGEIKDKLKKLSEFKFSICFENTIAEGYISEKIFDCFKARCVPVYLGASNIEKYIDRACYVDARKFKNYDELLFYLENIGAKKYQEYIDSIESFLKNEKNQTIWFERGFKKAFMSAVI